MKTLLMLFAVIATAKAAEPVWSGVWSGTIGTLDVQVCLQHNDAYDQGVYFYLRHLSLIKLAPANEKTKPGETQEWKEAARHSKLAAVPLWMLAITDANHLSGTWQGNGKTLPITLSRVALETDEEPPCGTVAFSKPRATPPKLSSQPASFNGIAYSKLIADVGKHFGMTIESFQLAGTTPEIQRVNEGLRKTIPQTAVGSAYLECSMGNIGSVGEEGEYADVTKPKLITEHWMVSEEDLSTNCGGPHPNHDVSWRNWDLQGGREVDLWTWFPASVAKEVIHEEGTANAYTELTLGPALRKKLNSAYARKREDCLSAVESFDTWDPHLTKTGMAFTPELPFVVAACIEDVVIPFAQVQPLLNAMGKRGVASFMADLASH